MALTLGCLPAGDPPRGRHLVADRTLSAVQFSASEQEGVPAYLLVSGPVHSETSSDAGAAAELPKTDLYWIPDEARALSLPRALAKGRPVLVVSSLQVPQPQYDPVLADTLGRLVVQHRDPDKPDDPLAFRISRFDLANKTWTRLTTINRGSRAVHQPELKLSPGRSRVVIDSGNLEIFELENQRAWVETDGRWYFWGEDIFFSRYDSQARSSLVSRLKPHGAPQSFVRRADLLAVFGFLPDATRAAEPRVVLVEAPRTFFVVDPDRGQRTNLPYLVNFTISPSGRWVTGTDSNNGSSQVFVDWSTGTNQVAASWPADPKLRRWRPGRDEHWARTGDSQLSIWQADGTIRTIDAKLDSFSFSDDGRFWFPSEEREAGWRQHYVGLADAPEGPRYPTNPPGTFSFQLEVLAGNWVLVDLWLDEEGSRFDYAAVDPTTGQSQMLAVKGRLIAASPTRILAYANWDDGRKSGELALFDLASGAKTVLADGVYAAALDPGFHSAPQPNTDRLAPGTRVAFLVRHRFASAYDGLWVTELP